MNMKLWLTIFVACIGLAPHSQGTDQQSHEIMVLTKIQVGQSFFNSIPPNALVVFDIDNVLLTTENQLQNLESQRNLTQKFTTAQKQLNLESLDALLKPREKIKYAFESVEQGFAQVIEQLQSRDVPCIACTGLSVFDIKHQAIKSAGIDFGKQFEYNEALKPYFTSDEARVRTRWGYIVSNDKPKTIQRFIQVYNQTQPEENQIEGIVMIEDYLGTLIKMKDELDSTLKFVGLHYTYVAEHLSVQDIVDAYNQIQSQS